MAIMVCDTTVLQYSLHVQRVTYNIKKIANKLRYTSVLLGVIKNANIFLRLWL